MVIKMLPEDLAFTLFLPSKKALGCGLSLNPKENLAGEKANDTYAILIRVLGFSVVPRTIYLADLQYGKEIVYDSISGFNLYILKDLDGMLVVNRVALEHVDLKLKNIIAYVMNEVIMDSKFEESMQPNYEKEGN
ncbi:Fasciclin-like arabinogalactan family protein [Abeliophyllum distichum]|uniref:Fasciclin-like arabinogalactan family protein n=1 Tax=Abeliophyllum distichum TaxID=126358 RepID=A0ABD1UMC4_9LAMI